MGTSILSSPDDIIKDYQRTFIDLRKELEQVVGVHTQIAVYRILNKIETLGM